MMMAHKCFISFKTEDYHYKKYIQENMGINMIDKSLDYSIPSDDHGHVMRKIRENHLHDSTVTIFLIGSKSSENLGRYEQRYIKSELQASLYHGVGNTQNGILGIVLPSVTDKIYGGTYLCSHCSGSHNLVRINDDTVIKEFSRNYYIYPDRCFHTEDDRYCVLVKWEDFKANPEWYIEQAFNKRNHSISAKTVVRP